MAIAEWVLTGGLLAGIGYACVRSLVSSGRSGRLRLLARRRAPRARRATIEAALDDPAFAPERIEAAVTGMLDEVLGPDAHVVGGLRVDILGVVNRARDSEDRVVVRVRARVDRGAAPPPPTRGAAARGGPPRTRVDERWTLVRRGHTWSLATDRSDALTESLLRAPLIASPEHDDERLHEASLEELTELGRHRGSSPAELTDSQAAPARQLQDLSLADERFEPLLIEAAVRHIVDAWEQSTDSSDAPLLAVATGAGAHALLFPGTGRGRRGIGDARLQRWEVARVDAAATPPRVDVHVRVRAVVPPDPQVRRLDLVWTLELDETTHAHPRWRLVGSADAR